MHRQFDAFISYRHGSAAGFAKALKNRLERYGRRVYQRSRRIFRDEDYITSDPDLPALVRRSIDASSYLLLLASPEAAASQWVEKEVAEWCAVPERLDRLIIVLLTGEIATNAALGIEWEKTTALPPCLRGYLLSVPFYVDMTWASHEPHLPLSSDRVKVAINNIAAKIDGRTPEEMLGQHSATRRWQRRALATVVSGIAVLLAALLWLSRLNRLEHANADLLREAQLASSELELDPTAGLLRAIQVTGHALALNRVVPPAVQSALSHAMEASREQNLLFHAPVVNSVAFRPDGTMIASGGSDGAIRLWSIDGRAATGPLFHGSNVRSVAFSPTQEKRLVSGSADGTLRIWDLEGRPVGPPFEHHGGVSAVSWQPNGPWLISGGNDGTLCLWRVSQSAPCSPIRAHQGAVRSVALSSDGRWLATGGADQSVCLFALDSKSGRLTLKGCGRGHTKSVMGVAFLRDGEGFISGGDRTLRIWDLRARAREVIQVDQDITSIAVDPVAGIVASGGLDGTVRQFQRDGQEVPPVFRGPTGGVTSVAYSPKGSLIALGGIDGTIRVRGSQGMQVEPPVVQLQTGISALAFLPRGDVTIGDMNGVVRIQGSDRTTREVSLAAESHHGPIWSLAASVDGKRFASGGDDGTVRIWDQNARLAVPPLAAHQGGVNGVAIDPVSGTIASAGNDGAVRLWTLGGQPRKTIEGDTGKVMSLAWHPTASLLATGANDGTLRIWGLDGRAVAEFKGIFGGRHNSLSFSPDGELLIAADGERWHLVRWKQGPQATSDFATPGEKVQSLAMTNDGAVIASGGSNGTVVLWNTQGHTLAQFQHPRGLSGVLSMAFSPDGRLLASGGWDGSVRLWRANWREWLSASCERLRRHPRMIESTDPISMGALCTCRKWAGAPNDRVSLAWQ